MLFEDKDVIVDNKPTFDPVEINANKRIRFEESIYAHYVSTTLADSFKAGKAPEVISKLDFLTLNDDGTYKNMSLTYAFIGYELSLRDILQEMIDLGVFEQPAEE